MENLALLISDNPAHLLFEGAKAIYYTWDRSQHVSDSTRLNHGVDGGKVFGPPVHRLLVVQVRSWRRVDLWIIQNKD